MMSATARKSLATKLNGMIDVPFIGEQQEQMMAEVIIEKVLEALCSDPSSSSSTGDAGLDQVDVTTADGESTMKKNMIKKINAKINLPFANEEQEAMILSVIVDMIFKEKFGDQNAAASSTSASDTPSASASAPVMANSSDDPSS